MKHLFFALLMIMAIVCIATMTFSGPPPAKAASQASFSACQDWLLTEHTLNYPTHGCGEYSYILNAVETQGGSVVPLGDKFFIARFPSSWDRLANRKLIITLPGSGGCAERLYEWWNRPAADRQYALVVLQYASENASGETIFEDSSQIYANIVEIFALLNEHCLLDHTSIIYHGFSMGSARSFEIALLDRAADGAHIFSSFISDSGTGFAEYNGQLPPMLQAAGTDAYEGAHFWLYCGGQDHDGQTCRDMEKMERFIVSHGGTVDAFNEYPQGGHGIFSTVNPGNGRSNTELAAMLDYIDSIGNER